MDTPRYAKTAPRAFGLKAKLLIPLIGIALSALFATGLAIVRIAEQGLIDASQEKLINSAAVVGNSILEKIARARADMTFTPDVPGVAASVNPEEKENFPDRAAYVAHINTLLAKLGEVCGYYETFYVVSDKGMTLVCSMPSAVGTLDISNRAWFHEAMATDNSILSEPFRSRITGDALMAIAQRFTHKDIRGVMVGSIQIHKITHAAVELEAKPWLQVYVVTDQGAVVAALDEKLLATSAFAAKPWFPSVLEADRGQFTMQEDGEQKLVAFYHLQGTNLRAVAVADAAHLLGPARAVRNIGLIAVLLSVLLACGIIYLTVAPVTRDIQRLADFAESVAQGDMEHEVQLARQDELGTLSRSLLRMLHTLKQMITRAEEATRAKSEFLANMSHEIRTPMNAVMGMAHLALQANPEGRQRDALLKIRRASESLLAIINDILDFSKVEAGKLELDHVPFRLADMVQSVGDMLEEDAKRKGLVLDLRVAPDIPALVVGDPVRLKQICINLCNNAIKFTSKGSVSLRVSLWETQGDELTLLFSVVDTGIGISPEQREMIFDAFAQADGSTTRRYGGTGLGLAISRRLVELMHGSIWVESEVNQGSTFHFTIRVAPGPRDLPEASCSELPERTEKVVENLLVLLVEDNDLNQEIAVELLRSMGADPVVANNGEEAVRFWLEHDIDLIFMDIQMPVMDGLEAARRIRASGKPGSAAVPIIAMTANAMNVDREKSRDAGMNGHLTKPIDCDELRRALQDWGQKARERVTPA